MAKFDGNDAQVVQTVGKGIPQKCRTQQKSDKRPGPVKVWMSADKRGNERYLERQKNRQENMKVKNSANRSQRVKGFFSTHGQKPFII